MTAIIAIDHSKEPKDKNKNKKIFSIHEMMDAAIKLITAIYKIEKFCNTYANKAGTSKKSI